MASQRGGWTRWIQLVWSVNILLSMKNCIRRPLLSAGMAQAWWFGYCLSVVKLMVGFFPYGSFWKMPSISSPLPSVHVVLVTAALGPRSKVLCSPVLCILGPFQIQLKKTYIKLSTLFEKFNSFTFIHYHANSFSSHLTCFFSYYFDRGVWHQF